jgi:hypothetical protein
MPKGKGGSQTVSTQLDPTMESIRNQVWRAGRAAAGTPGLAMDPAARAAMDSLGRVAGAGNLGIGALSSGDFSAFMNPYQGQVIDAVHQQYGDLRDQATLDVNDMATKARSFGGSRHGIATGQALGELYKGEGQTIAGLMKSGYDDARGQAMGLANLGMGASGQLFQMGDARRRIEMENDPNMRRFMILQAAMQGLPYGTTQTTPMGSNAGAGFLGGAATGASIGSNFGPWGTAIGAGAGGLLGLF